jgi:hypothetical protein
MDAKMRHVGLIPIFPEFIFWHGFGFNLSRKEKPTIN